MAYNRKILLLGCGESGKSTFIKQLKIINSENDSNISFTEEEKSNFKKHIASNILSSIIAMANHVEQVWSYIRSISTFN